MKAKSSSNDPKWIVNKDIGYVSQIFLPKMMGNDPMPCSFVYMIAPIELTKNDYKSINHVQIHNLGHFLEKNVTWLNLVLVLLLKWSIVPTFLVVSATTGYNLQWYSSHWANKITAESDDFLSIETMY